MLIEFTDIQLDACPFCGVPTWTGYVSCVRSSLGDELTCRHCGAYTWQGVVINAGKQPDRESVEHAVRIAFPGVSLDEPAFVAPEHRRTRVSFDPCEPAHAPETDR
jgi:hypothetical protein